ncbi:MAG: HPP family protein [Caldimicrobium sp.]
MENFNFKPTKEDILNAFKRIEGYLDITIEDFQKLYGLVSQIWWERLIKEIKAKDIMNPQVIFASPEETLEEIVRKLVKAKISGLPIVENEKVIGLLSEKDIFKKLEIDINFKCLSIFLNLEKTIQSWERLKKTKAKEIMTTPAITIEENSSVEEVFKIMKLHKINRIPVVNSQGKLVGIITREDLLKHPFFRVELS